MNFEGGFQSRSLYVLAGVAVVSLLVAGALALDPPAPKADPVVPDTANVAASGHRALLQLLRELDIPVRAGPGAWRGKGVLVVLAPDLASSGGAARLLQLLSTADRALVLLPKWTGTSDPKHPKWFSQVQLLPASHVEAVFLALGLTGTLRRDPQTAQIGGTLGVGKAELSAPQLIAGSELVSLIGGERGLVAGEREEKDKLRGKKQKLIVVSDPDLFDNQGLPRGDNARIALALLNRLRDPKDPKDVVVLEESLLEGHRTALFSGLLRFPTVLGVLHILLLSAVAVWAGVRRFGAPVPEAATGPRGSEALIEGAVALQRISGRAAHAVSVLLTSALLEVSQRLHAPAALSGAALDRWLDQRAAARGLEARVDKLRNSFSLAAAPRELLAAARAVQRWRKGMIDGSG